MFCMTLPNMQLSRMVFYNLKTENENYNSLTVSVMYTVKFTICFITCQHIMCSKGVFVHKFTVNSYYYQLHIVVLIFDIVIILHTHFLLYCFLAYTFFYYIFFYDNPCYQFENFPGYNAFGYNLSYFNNILIPCVMK